MINRHNYEEYFLLYADNELDAQEQLAVEHFIHANPDLKAMLEQCYGLKISPDTDIVFANKHSLYKPVGNKRIVTIFKWWHAAAILLVIATGVWVANQQAGTLADTIVAKGMTSIDTFTDMAGKVTRHQEDLQPVTKVLDVGFTNTKDDLKKADKRVPKQVAIIIENEPVATVEKITKYTVPQDKQVAVVESPAIAPLPLSVQNDIASENKIEMLAVDKLPESLNTSLIPTSIASGTIADREDETAAKYIQSRKNKLFGVVRKAATIVDKTIFHAAGLRNTQQVNVKVGRYEVALH